MLKYFRLNLKEKKRKETTKPKFLNAGIKDLSSLFLEEGFSGLGNYQYLIAVEN
jgi:hypothetical protein